jgi:hypothetical protein
VDVVQTIGSSLGLGLLAGIRLYATVFGLGLAIRLGWLDLPQNLSQLSVLADTRVLTVSGIAFVAEFFADKIPWVDSAWDSIHTFIRPIGAALLGAAAAASLDPSLQLVLMLLAGGIGFSGHSSKAATRLAANHSPEPFSNVALSLAGDLALPAGIWVAVERPEIMLGVVIVFMVIFLWLGPKIIRLLRVEWTAFRSVLASWFGSGSTVPSPAMPAGLTENMTRVLTVLRERDVAIPREEAQFVESKLGWRPSVGWLAAAGPGVKGLKSSIGYLFLGEDRLAFVTRRLFRNRVHTVELREVREARLHRRFFLDEFELDLGARTERFDLFKAPKPEPAPAARWQQQSS